MSPIKFRSPSPERIRPSGTGSQTSIAKQQAELERRRDVPRWRREVAAMDENDLREKERRERESKEYNDYLDTLIQ